MTAAGPGLAVPTRQGTPTSYGRAAYKHADGSNARATGEQQCRVPVTTLEELVKKWA